MVPHWPFSSSYIFGYPPDTSSNLPATRLSRAPRMLVGNCHFWARGPRKSMKRDILSSTRLHKLSISNELRSRLVGYSPSSYHSSRPAPVTWDKSCWPWTSIAKQNCVIRFTSPTTGVPASKFPLFVGAIPLHFQLSGLKCSTAIISALAGIA